MRYSEISSNVFESEDEEAEAFVCAQAPPISVTSGFGGMVWREFRRITNKEFEEGFDRKGVYLPEEYQDIVFRCGMRYAFSLLKEQNKNSLVAGANS